MSALKGLLSNKRSSKNTSKTNITKYTVGTRVPRNEEAERIVRNALAHQPSRLMKLK
ncbi:hypothetical protein [Paenibacillus sp. MY03]|uniref:hypothetical protein n=1 Tax=Paenibacillus sp. MY03 TaxID=302980 RepID=UPI0015C61F3E|nr:hypothetical protein [Paenibacillus sp. MY03]